MTKRKRVRAPAPMHWPHPGPFEKTWLGCRTCGYHWFPVEKKPERCPRCERELGKTREQRQRHVVTGTGVPADPRALLLCKCYRCGYEWFWRKRIPLLPKYCGNVRCTSPYWGSPRVLAPGVPWSMAKRGRKQPVRKVVRDAHADEPRRAGGGGLQI